MTTAGVDYGIYKLRHLIEPHIKVVVEDDQMVFPLPCFEGTNHCYKDGRKGQIWANEDFVFIRESDTIAAGTITLYPSHRDCAVAEWGEDHIIP